jgi:glycine cleavage system aminomethyltransferase T
VSCEFDPRSLTRDYGDVRAEALSCRSAAALFDFSFMRRTRVRGANAQALVQSLTPRPLGDLSPGRLRYALRVDADGHVLSDLTIWRLDGSTFEVFAGTREAFAHLAPRADATTDVSDLSEETAIFAVQGPSSLRVLAGVASIGWLRAVPYFGHAQETIAGAACRIGRLGYTGERGFEIILPREARDTIWAKLAAHVRPAGFAAADILRIEAGFPLFANEFLFPVTAAELGLTRFAAGPSALCGAPSLQRAAPPPMRLVSFEAQCDSEPILWHPRRDSIFQPQPGLLFATSACRSIVSGRVLGLGYVCAGQAMAPLRDPTAVFQDIREVPLPFYDRHKRRPRGGWGEDLLPDGILAHHSHE